MLLRFFFTIQGWFSYEVMMLRSKLYGLGFKKFGKGVAVSFPVKVFGKENISIGNHCSINAFVHIWGNGGLEIGNNVMIASNCSITTLTHDYSAESMRFAPVIKSSIVIEDDVWLGSGAVLLPGIKIGRGAVIGAGAVVTKDVPAYAIMVGNPARILKMRIIAT